MRRSSGTPLPLVRGAQRAGREVLRRVCPAAAGGRPGGIAERRPCADTRLRTASRVDPVRRPGRVHDTGRRQGCRGHPRAPDRLLRPLAGCDRPLWRDHREVHRRRGDGRLGRSDRPRGRCRTGGPGGARPGGRGPDARTDDPGPRRRPDRRSRGHHGRDKPGDGRRRPRQHGLTPPISRGARHRLGRRGDPSRRLQRHRLRGGRRADAQGQDEPGPGVARAPRRRRARRSQPIRDAGGPVRRS